MGLFRRLFGGGRSNVVEPDIRFGRYSDSYKADIKYDAWDHSLDLFDSGKFTESYIQFFDYLYDEEQDNVRSEQRNGTLTFELFQGSKVITGTIDDKIIKAEAKVARTKDLSIGFLRRMMELNYTLKYSRFALDENDDLTLVFDSFLLDGSPYKLYYALKEIAVSADKQDDLLVGEFDVLDPINTSHIEEIPIEELKVKTAYLREEIKRAFDFIDNTKINTDQYAGGVGYFLLELAYRLDYILRPEGELTEALERIHRIYFTKDNRSSSDKNATVRKELEQILARSDEDLQREMYLTHYTFGITSPASHEQLVSFIDAELNNMDWYVQNRHRELALAFPGYICGFCHFNYAFEPPLKELLHLYYRITQPDLFEELGFAPRYYETDGDYLYNKEIIGALEDWRDTFKEKYSKLQVDVRSLDFTSLTAFAKTYFLMMRDLDMTKKTRN